jgi:hypothetical protein
VAKIITAKTWQLAPGLDGRRRSKTIVTPPPDTTPDYPWLGSYALGGTQAYWDPAVQAALAKRHRVVMNNYPGLGRSAGATIKGCCQSIKALSTVGTKIWNYFIPGEIENRNANTNEAKWELWKWLADNKAFLYTNGLTETGPVASDVTAWTVINFGPDAKVVSGKDWAQYMVDWTLRLCRDGGTFSNGAGNITVVANPYLDGLYIDNVFWRGRRDGDYKRIGSLNGVTSDPAMITYYQSAHARLINKIKTAWPGAPVLVNSADWPEQGRLGLGNFGDGPLDQAAAGGVLERIMIYEIYYSFKEMLRAVSVQMDSYSGDKDGIFQVDISSLTNFKAMRYSFGISQITNTFHYPHAGSGYLVQDLPSTWFDEYDFNLGQAIDPPQTTPTYYANASTGEGVYRRRFENGDIYVGARRGSGSLSASDQVTPYPAISLSNKWRLRGTQAPTINSGAAITSLSLAPQDAIVVRNTPPP